MKYKRQNARAMKIISKNPTPETIVKAKKAYELLQTHTGDQVAKILDDHRSYVIALRNWYRDNFINK